MISVIFYTFSKRKNSTKIPAVEGLTMECEIKRDCSVTAPRLIIYAKKPTEFNYCKIADFGRYYFIRSWNWENGVWSADCVVDELASWRDFIAKSEQYVTRSSSAMDGNVIDTFYPTTAKIDTVVSEVANPWSGALSGGTYVLGVIGQGAVSSGAVTYYAFTPGALARFIDQLLNSENIIGGMIGENPDFEISDSLATLIFNPIQYISVCMWYPFSFGGAGNPIRVGWWGSIEGGIPLPAEFLQTAPFSFSFPQHPQAQERGAFLNRVPFSSHTVSVPPFGSFAIPESMINANGATTVNAHIRVDIVTGTAYLTLSSGDVETQPIIRAVGQVGITVPITSLQSGYGKTVSGAVSSAVEALSGNVFGGLMGLANSAIGVFSGTMSPTPTTVGAVQGSKLPYFGNNPSAVSCYCYVADDDLEHFGRPFCKKVRLGSLTGYIKCENAETEIPATENEVTAIDGYLNGGFFYE